jgi:ABC-type lipoprotein export system ATPase subunit
VVTHNDEIASKADRIIRLVDGKINDYEEKIWNMQKEK